MLHLSLVVAVSASIALAGTAAAWAGPVPPVMPGSACRTGVQHVALLSGLQMCPRPLATTVIARPRHVPLHT